MLKLRIETQNGRVVSSISETEEMLSVLADAELKLIELTFDEEETLRGWLLMRAQELPAGKVFENFKGSHVSLGKTAEGKTYLRDHRGEWPPQKPAESEQLFKS